MRRIADGLGRRLNFNTADIGDDLPDFFIGHANALAVGSVGGHDGARDSVADHLKHFFVGVNMPLLCPCQIRPASAAMSAQSVAQRAVDAEFILASFRRLAILGKRIVIFDRMGCSCGHQQQGRT